MNCRPTAPAPTTRSSPIGGLQLRACQHRSHEPRLRSSRAQRIFGHRQPECGLTPCFLSRSAKLRSVIPAAILQLRTGFTENAEICSCDRIHPRAGRSHPNRAALVELNKARAESAAEVAELQARMNRLADLKGAVGPIEAELSALDGAEAAAFAAWSATPDAPAPTPDIAARQSIMDRLSGARQSVSSAERATASVEYVLGNAHARANALQHRVPAAVAACLLDEARELLPEIVEAAKAVAKVKARYDSLRKFMLERAEASKAVSLQNGFFGDLEALDRDAREAFAISPMLSFAAGNEWRDLATSSATFRLSSLTRRSSIPSPLRRVRSAASEPTVTEHGTDDPPNSIAGASQRLTKSAACLPRRQSKRSLPPVGNTVSSSTRRRWSLTISAPR